MSFSHTFRILALCLIGILYFSQTGYSQSTNPGTARANSPTSILIDENTRLQDEYIADISALGFATEADAKRFFGRITDNRLSYRVNMSANHVVIKLHRDRAPATWTAADWNNYINRKINSL